jgi:predicted  nucleic acid-binding Zn ribbon protein
MKEQTVGKERIKTIKCKSCGHEWEIECDDSDTVIPRCHYCSSVDTKEINQTNTN